MQGKVYTPTDIKAYKTLRTYLMIPTVVVSESSRRSMNQPWTGASPGSTAAAQHRSIRDERFTHAQVATCSLSQGR